MEVSRHTLGTISGWGGECAKESEASEVCLNFPAFKKSLSPEILRDIYIERERILYIYKILVVIFLKDMLIYSF